MQEIEDCDRGIETIIAWRRDRNDAAIARFVGCCRRVLGG